MCYLEPLFLWQPFLCLRKEMYISGDIEYINIGDSHYIGNPKVGNGLGNHLHELKNVFSDDIEWNASLFDGDVSLDAID